MNTATTFTSVECYQLLHNRRNKSYNKSRQIGVGLRELEYCGRQTCSKIYSLWFYKLIFDSQGRRGERRKCRQQARPSMSFDDNMIDLLGENLLSGTKFKSVPLSGGYRNFLRTRCRTGERKHPCQKPARFAQPFRHNADLWRTDERTHDDSAYTALA